MILNFFAIVIIYLSIVGYSIVFKYFINNFSIKEFNNLDIIYGIFLLSFIAVIIHFIVPLKIVNYFIIILGIIFKVYFLIVKKIRLNINYFFLFSIIFFFIFISFSTGTLVDSSLYHLQTIKWFSEYKITFGLSNLEPRLGINSLWHVFLSLFNFRFYQIQTIYFLSSLVHAVLIYEVFLNKNNFYKLSNFFLAFSIIFILIFAIIHPFENGTIYYLIGSPENDTVVMCYFIITIYLFFKLLEEGKNNEYLNLIILYSLVAALSKLSHLSLILIPFLLIVVFKYSKIINKINLLSFFLFFIMIVRSVSLSGCIFFPVASTCLKNIPWGLPITDVDTAAKIYKSFARDTPLRQKWTDFDYTLNSFDWLYPWFNEYVLETSFFIIIFILIFIFLIFFLIAKVYKMKNKTKFINYSTFFYTVVLLYLSTFIIWFQSPAIRYAYGPFVSIISILFCILLFNYYFKFILKFKTIFNYKILFLSVLICLIILFNKNLGNLKYAFDSLPNKNEKPINLVFLDNVNGRKIYHSYSCGYFLGICVSGSNFKYQINEKNNYLFFSRIKK